MTDHQKGSDKIYDRNVSFGLRQSAAFYFRHAPAATLGMYLLKILFSLLPFLTVIASARFVDRVLDMSFQGEKGALGSAALIALLMLVREVGSNLYAFLRTKQWSRTYPVMDRMVAQKIAALPYEKVEDDRVQDILSRVKEDPEGLLSGIIEGYLELGGFLVSNVSLVAVLVTQAPAWVSAVITGLLVCFGIFAVKGGERQYEARAEVTLRRRKAEYYGDILKNRALAQERMLFGYGGSIDEAYLKESREARKLERKTSKRWLIGMNLGAYIAIGISVLVILTLVTPVLQGRISVGLFVSLVTAFMSMTQNITWQFPGMLKEMAKGRRMLGDFNTVLQMPVAAEPETDIPAEGTAFETLEFRHVSFRYPGTEKEVLKNLSFRIERGKHYAFAGRNGCGKSTIVKLILRLYEPDGGEILLNHRNIREYAPGQIWSMFAVLFQDYARYPVSVYENIALGDRAMQNAAAISGRPEGGVGSGENGPAQKAGLKGKMDAGKKTVGAGVRSANGKKTVESGDGLCAEPAADRVRQAASRAGLEGLLKKLPDGLDTELGKLSEISVDLSGGEWQRVAMARMECSKASVRILDEPTAAMDPVQEQTVYRQFSDMNQDKTTIMITHRLGATWLSDCIFVIEDGRVMEEGSHSLLMEKQGIYSEMYEKQREWYL